MCRARPPLTSNPRWRRASDGMHLGRGRQDGQRGPLPPTDPVDPRRPRTWSGTVPASRGSCSPPPSAGANEAPERGRVGIGSSPPSTVRVAAHGNPWPLCRARPHDEEVRAAPPPNRDRNTRCAAAIGPPSPDDGHGGPPHGLGMTTRPTFGLPAAVRACLFDLDGVLTRTASVHAAAWKEMLDSFLRMRANQRGESFVPFDEFADYDIYVDGKPRADGTRSFLASRHINLPDGDPDDPAGEETRSSATSTPPATTSSKRVPGSNCWPRRHGCGVRTATTTPRAGSASTGSPDPTSTPRSPTTTST